MNPSIVSLLAVATATFACALAAALVPNRDGRELFQALYLWLLRLAGRCLTTIVLIQAAATGLKLMGVLK